MEETNYENTELRHDVLTNELFKPDRVTQRFKNATNRLKYYALKAKEKRQKTAYINNPLRKNLNILEKLMENQKEAVFHKQFLLGKGFSFNIHTHVEYNGEKNCYAIYDFLFEPIGKDELKILRYHD